MRLKAQEELKHGDLRVWWYPQIPMKECYEVDVPDAKTAKLLLDTLAHYDLFQLKHNIKPDYSNAGGLNVWDERLDVDEQGEKWTTWEDIDFDDIDATETFQWEGQPADPKEGA